MAEDGIGVNAGITAPKRVTNLDVRDDTAAGTVAHLVAIGNALDGNFAAFAAIGLGINRDTSHRFAPRGVVRPVAGLPLGDIIQHFEVFIFQ